MRDVVHPGDTKLLLLYKALGQLCTYNTPFSLSLFPKENKYINK